MRVAALLLAGLLAAPGTSTAAAQAPTPRDCPGLALLGDDASDEVKRITCEIPGEYRRQVGDAQVEGWLLRYHDAAAWTSTDALREKKAFEAIPGTATGWLTREVEDGIDVTYFSLIEGEPSAFAEAHFDREKFKITRAQRLATPRPADERERRQLKARQTALAAPRLQCTSTINTVILEDESAPGIRVYVLSGWDEAAFPMGGHSLFHVSADGEHILESFQQSKACLNFDPAELRKHMPFVTDLVDQSPSAIQVFLNHEIKSPFVVVTEASERIWKVDEGRIHVVPEEDELAKAIRKANP